MTPYLGSDRGREVTRYVAAELREREDGEIVGRAPAPAHLRGEHGGVRTGVILTLLDYVGGLCGGLAALPDGWVVSTNLAARVVETEHTGPFRIHSRVLRRGRNNVVTAVHLVDEGARDALVADGVLTSAILVPENGPPPWARPLVLEPLPASADAPPVREWLGVRTSVGDRGRVEIDLVDDLRNPWGIMHGGVVAMLVDLAAQDATAGGVTRDVVVHFLAPNRVGPVVAHARPVGTRADGTVNRVEVRDTAADRATAIAVATVSAP